MKNGSTIDSINKTGGALAVTERIGDATWISSRLVTVAVVACVASREKETSINAEDRSETHSSDLLRALQLATLKHSCFLQDKQNRPVFKEPLQGTCQMWHNVRLEQEQPSACCISQTVMLCDRLSMTVKKAGGPPQWKEHEKEEREQQS